MDYNKVIVLSAILPIQFEAEREVITMTKEQIYERMTVQFVTPDPETPCEFDEGKPCDLLYQRVCEARKRIAERTGIDFEDRDLLTMVEGLEEIGKVLALKMYGYGTAYGKPEA